ncbi:hypothetical protein SeMB42_g06259 [Synchytrium endobioticum]|uniref:Uncharacterized protein n=1 Tax=Synchytrium endobioticum TaxID=286115 RepID=A0A507CJR5_9FUNG|nr:hypothetical protein SeMB42_g06259 [Synchytrium endobioticum]
MTSGSTPIAPSPHRRCQRHQYLGRCVTPYISRHRLRPQAVLHQHQDRSSTNHRAGSHFHHHQPWRVSIG